MASSNAVTELPRMPRIDGEAVKPASSIIRATLTGSALDRNSLLESGILVAERLADEKIDLLTVLAIRTLVPSPRRLIIASPFNYLGPLQPTPRDLPREPTRFVVPLKRREHLGVDLSHRRPLY
jgi:hypothetical protein